MKKILKNLFFCLIALLVFVTVSNADISSNADIYRNTAKLKELCDIDIATFVNKSELIGMRADSFNMQTEQYKKFIYNAQIQLQNKIQRLQVIENSIDYSDSEKNMQKSQVYQDVSVILSDLNTYTYNYINQLEYIMPTITYQRFSKKFLEYYKSLELG